MSVTLLPLLHMACPHEELDYHICRVVCEFELSDVMECLFRYAGQEHSRSGYLLDTGHRLWYFLIRKPHCSSTPSTVGRWAIPCCESDGPCREHRGSQGVSATTIWSKWYWTRVAIQAARQSARIRRVAEFAGSLRLLASKAFPGWTDAQVITQPLRVFCP